MIITVRVSENYKIIFDEKCSQAVCMYKYKGIQLMISIFRLEQTFNTGIYII